MDNNEIMDTFEQYSVAWKLFQRENNILGLQIKVPVILDSFVPLPRVRPDPLNPYA